MNGERANQHEDPPEEVLQLGDCLDAAKAIMRGEADELEMFIEEDVVVGPAADALQDVIDGLRLRADESEEVLEEYYFQGDDSQ